MSADPKSTTCKRERSCLSVVLAGSQLWICQPRARRRDGDRPGARESGENTRASSVCSGTPLSRVVPADGARLPLTIGGSDSYFDGPAVRITIPPPESAYLLRDSRAACVVPSVTRPADQQRDDDGDGQAHARYCRHADPPRSRLRCGATQREVRVCISRRQTPTRLLSHATPWASFPTPTATASRAASSCRSAPIRATRTATTTTAWTAMRSGPTRISGAIACRSPGTSTPTWTGNAVIDMDDSVKRSWPSEPRRCSGRRRTFDRYIPDPSKPWRVAPANDGVDLADVLASLRSFGADCTQSTLNPQCPGLMSGVQGRPALDRDDRPSHRAQRHRGWRRTEVCRLDQHGRNRLRVREVEYHLPDVYLQPGDLPRRRPVGRRAPTARAGISLALFCYANAGGTPVPPTPRRRRGRRSTRPYRRRRRRRGRRRGRRPTRPCRPSTPTRTPTNTPALPSITPTATPTRTGTPAACEPALIPTPARNGACHEHRLPGRRHDAREPVAVCRSSDRSPRTTTATRPSTQRAAHLHAQRRRLAPRR